MSLKCDFCGDDTIRKKDITLIQSGDGVHICENCVKLSMDIITNSKNKKSFDQALAETKEKHTDVIDRLSRND